MTKKVEKTSLYRVYLRNLFSDTFFKNSDCSVTQTPLAPLNGISGKDSKVSAGGGGGRIARFSGGKRSKTVQRHRLENFLDFFEKLLLKYEIKSGSLSIWGKNFMMFREKLLLKTAMKSKNMGI